METIIYYFTGTGNSLKIAKDIQGNIKNCKIQRICKQNMAIKVGKAERIGFVFPVYYRGLPKMVAHFIENLNVQSVKYFFAVANFGSYAALTFEQIDKILKGKGKGLSANFSLPMPGNMWFMYYPHPKEDFINRMNEEPLFAKQIAQRINEEFTNEIAPIPDRKKEEEMYVAFQPDRQDENFWVTQNCSSCGICSKVCPAENIKLIDGQPSWSHQCEQCLACLHLCPKEAIEFKKDSIARERYKNINVQLSELMS